VPVAATIGRIASAAFRTASRGVHSPVIAR
jgi:hypothetical protein